MPKRFSDLEKSAIAILANGGNPANSQDEAVQKYWQWKINPSSNAHKFTGPLAGSKRSTGRKLTTLYITPFDAIVSSTTRAAVSVSSRALSEVPESVRNATGCEAEPGTNNQGIRIGKFKPAKVYYRTGTAASSSDRTSRITGRTYKSYYTPTDQGYSYPFGVVSSGTEKARQTAIADAIRAANETIDLITFSPQVYRPPV